MNIGPIIRPKTGHNRYCGPAALSAICRIDTAKAAQVLREVTGKASIKGVYEGQMVRALGKLGYRALQVSGPLEQSLAAWLKVNNLKTRGAKVYLIAAGHHYITIQGRRGVCNQTKGVVPLGEIKKRRASIQSVYVISKKNVLPTVPRVPGVKPKAPPKLLPLKTVAAAEAALAKAKIAADAALAKVRAEELRLAATRKWVAEQKVRDERNRVAKARRDAAKAGITIELERMAGGSVWWVYGPKEVYGDGDGGQRRDPCEGSHGCHYPSEMADAVEEYLLDLAKLRKEVA
jgi:hypothetical protein